MAGGRRPSRPCAAGLIETGPLASPAEAAFLLRPGAGRVTRIGRAPLCDALAGESSPWSGSPLTGSSLDRDAEARSVDPGSRAPAGRAPSIKRYCESFAFALAIPRAEDRSGHRCPPASARAHAEASAQERRAVPRTTGGRDRASGRGLPAAGHPCRQAHPDEIAPPARRGRAASHRPTGRKPATPSSLLICKGSG